MVRDSSRSSTGFRPACRSPPRTSTVICAGPSSATGGARVAAGAVAKAVLRLVGMEVRSETKAIGNVESEPRFDAEAVEASEVRCADRARSDAMVAAIGAARDAGDTLGGIVALRVSG